LRPTQTGYYIMKKIVLFIAFTLSCVFSYGQSRELLKICLPYLNSQFPVVDGFLTMEKIDIVDDDLVIYVTIDEHELSIDDYKSSFEQNKSLAVRIVFNDDQDFYSLLNESKLGFKYIATGSLSNKQVELAISYSELLEIMDKPADSTELLDRFVSETRAGLPNECAPGVQMTDCYHEDGYLCYKLILDPSVLPFELFKSPTVQSMYIDGVISEFKAVTDPTERFVVDCLIENNIGMKYILGTDSSSETVTMIITPDMLK